MILSTFENLSPQSILSSEFELKCIYFEMYSVYELIIISIL